MGSNLRAFPIRLSAVRRLDPGGRQGRTQSVPFSATSCWTGWPSHEPLHSWVVFVQWQACWEIHHQTRWAVWQHNEGFTAAADVCSWSCERLYVYFRRQTFIPDWWQNCPRQKCLSWTGKERWFNRLALQKFDFSHFTSSLLVAVSGPAPNSSWGII